MRGVRRGVMVLLVAASCTTRGSGGDEGTGGAGATTAADGTGGDTGTDASEGTGSGDADSGTTTASEDSTDTTGDGGGTTSETGGLDCSTLDETQCRATSTCLEARGQAMVGDDTGDWWCEDAGFFACMDFDDCDADTRGWGCMGSEQYHFPTCFPPGYEACPPPANAEC